MHGRGTVSGLMRHRHGDESAVPARYLAYSKVSGPVIFWTLTNRCNLRCTHCYNYSGPESATEDELSTAEAMVLIDDLADMGVPLIIFTGGEPLLREDIFELARYAAGKGIGVALSSNGTLITADSALQIQESGISYVGISLDGADAETHNRFRGSPDALH